jgi:hypothetical protein
MCCENCEASYWNFLSNELECMSGGFYTQDPLKAIAVMGLSCKRIRELNPGKVCKGFKPEEEKSEG